MPDAESRSIQSLASRMRLARDNDDAYVLMLGAGASLSSNVPTTDEIIETLLKDYGQEVEGSVLDRFDKLWNSADEDRRHAYLEPFLNDPNRAPSPGYVRLAELINEGYFQLVISFNFDALLQKALEMSNADGTLELVAGYDPVDQIEKQLERERARPKIYQLHGSLRRPSTLKFSADDVFDYPPKVKEIITRQTSKNIIVCGYRFEDLNLIKAFADFGKELWWVNPESSPRYFKVAQRKRKSEDFVVTSDTGRFDDFFEKLHSALMRPKQKTADKEDAVRSNPFKFLASHREIDARFLFYRRRPIRKLYDAISNQRPRTLHFAGKRMVGKTSLIRAGLLPLISNDGAFKPIYIRRCGFHLTERLPTKIRRVTAKPLPGDTIEEILEQVTEEYSDKHVVLILDQFDNSIISMGRMDHTAAKRTLDVLFKQEFKNLTVVAVIADDVHFGEDLYVSFASDSENGYISNNMYQQLQPLTKHQVGRILQFQAGRADAGIPDALLERLVAQYDARRFTLAHIETICHLLVARINEDRRVVETDLEAGSRLVTALNAALLEHDILSYLEDLPVPEEQNLLRNVLLAASNTSRKDIAEYLKDNFARMHVDQIWTPDSNSGRKH